MLTGVEPDEWRQGPGRMLRAARGRRSKREAAKAAGIDEALWRQLEEGHRTIRGTAVPVNPRDENLEAAAEAVGIAPADLFRAAGRVYTPAAPQRDRVGELEERVDKIEERLRLLDDARSRATQRERDLGQASGS